MAEAKLDITGSTAVAQRELDKLTKGLASAREQIKQLNQATKDNAGTTNSWAAGMDRLKTQNDRWAQGMKKLQDMQPNRTVAGMKLDALREATAGLGQMAGSLIGITSVVGAATAAYSAWHNKVEEMIQGHADLSLSIVKTLAEAGKLALGPQVEQWAKGVKGATPAQAIAAYGGVAQSGETLSNARTMAVATEVAKLGPTGIDLTSMGTLAADVADIAGKDVSASDVMDLTVGLKQQLREKTEEFQGRKFQKQIEHLKRGGMSGEDALAHAVAALQSEQGSEALKVLATKGSQRTSDQRKMLKDVFAPEKLAAIKGQMEQFKSGDLAAGEIGALGTFGAGKEALGEQKIAKEKAEVQEQYGPYWSARSRFLRLQRERAYKGSTLSGVLTDVYQHTTGSVGTLMQGDLEQALANAKRNKTISDTEYQEFVTAIRENTQATKANTRSGVNVDAHTE